jgi:hypothetical protein
MCRTAPGPLGADGRHIHDAFAGHRAGGQRGHGGVHQGRSQPGKGRRARIGAAGRAAPRAGGRRRRRGRRRRAGRPCGGRCRRGHPGGVRLRGGASPGCSGPGGAGGRRAAVRVLRDGARNLHPRGVDRQRRRARHGAGGGVNPRRAVVGRASGTEMRCEQHETAHHDGGRNDPPADPRPAFPATARGGQDGERADRTRRCILHHGMEGRGEIRGQVPAVRAGSERSGPRIRTRDGARIARVGTGDEIVVHRIGAVRRDAVVIRHRWLTSSPSPSRAARRAARPRAV